MVARKLISYKCIIRKKVEGYKGQWSWLQELVLVNRIYSVVMIFLKCPSDVNTSNLYRPLYIGVFTYLKRKDVCAEWLAEGRVTK